MRRYSVRGWDMVAPFGTVDLGTFWWRWRAERAARRWRRSGGRYQRYAYIVDSKGGIA